MTINNFMNKSIGRWVSQRAYYQQGEEKLKSTQMKFEVKRFGSNTWEVHCGKEVYGFEVEKPGNMDSPVKRINTVMGPAKSTMSAPTEFTLYLNSVDEEKGLKFSESIVFAGDDLRLRTSTVYNSEGTPVLVGQYLEKRIK